MNFLDGSQRVGNGTHQPMPGYWYSTVVGQLQQVRVVLYEGRQQSRIVLENINGARQTVTLDDWQRLDLALHSPGVERRRRRGSGNPGKSSS